MHNQRVLLKHIKGADTVMFSIDSSNNPSSGAGSCNIDDNHTKTSAAAVQQDIAAIEQGRSVN